MNILHYGCPNKRYLKNTQRKIFNIHSRFAKGCKNIISTAVVAKQNNGTTMKLCHGFYLRTYTRYNCFGLSTGFWKFSVAFRQCERKSPSFI